MEVALPSPGNRKRAGSPSLEGPPRTLGQRMQRGPATLAELPLAAAAASAAMRVDSPVAAASAAMRAETSSEAASSTETMDGKITSFFKRRDGPAPVAKPTPCPVAEPFVTHPKGRGYVQKKMTMKQYEKQWAQYQKLTDDELPEALKPLIKSELQRYVNEPPGEGMGVIYASVYPNKKMYAGLHAHGKQGKAFIDSRAHKERCKNQPRIYNATWKYGLKNVRHFILDRVPATEEDSKELKRLEQHWISPAGLDTLAPKGYNATEGGEGNVPGPEMRANMSEGIRVAAKRKKAECGDDVFSKQAKVLRAAEKLKYGNDFHSKNAKTARETERKRYGDDYRKQLGKTAADKAREKHGDDIFSKRGKASAATQRAKYGDDVFSKQGKASAEKQRAKHGEDVLSKRIKASAETFKEKHGSDIFSIRGKANYAAYKAKHGDDAWSKLAKAAKADDVAARRARAREEVRKFEPSMRKRELGAFYYSRDGTQIMQARSHGGGLVDLEAFDPPLLVDALLAATLAKEVEDGLADERRQREEQRIAAVKEKYGEHAVSVIAKRAAADYKQKHGSAAISEHMKACRAPKVDARRKRALEEALPYESEMKRRKLGAFYLSRNGKQVMTSTDYGEQGCGLKAFKPPLLVPADVAARLASRPQVHGWRMRAFKEALPFENNSKKRKVGAYYYSQDGKQIMKALKYGEDDCRCRPLRPPLLVDEAFAAKLAEEEASGGAGSSGSSPTGEVGEVDAYVSDDE